MNRTTASDNGERRQAPRERRASRRLPFVVAVRQEPFAQQDPQPAKQVRKMTPQLGQSADLGLWGMRVRRCGSDLLARWTPIEVTFALPDGGQLLKLQAEVVFDQQQDASFSTTGLRFAALPPEVSARLETFLRGPGYSK